MIDISVKDLVKSFDTDENVLDGITGLSGGFCRRQIYTADDSTEPDMCDMIVLNSSGGSRAQVQLERKRSAMFAPGTLKISGTVYNGAKLEDDLTESWLKLWTMDMRIGIGETRQTAKWFYFNYSLADGVEIGWSNTAQTFKVYVVNGTIKGLVAIHAQLYAKYISAIPIDAGMYGHLFIDIEGNQGTDFELANLEIGYSRDRVVVQQGAPQTRSLTVARVSHHDYVSVSSGKVENNWNADCIFASDNNMNYGYGLIMNPTDKNYMQTAGYGASDEHPEQHLANRVTAFWQTARRETKVELLRNVAGLVTPKHKVTIDGKSYDIPLVNTMKVKEARQLLKVTKMEDSEQVDYLAEFLGRYMGPEIVDEMTFADMFEVFKLWLKANEEAGGLSLGE